MKTNKITLSSVCILFIILVGIQAQPFRLGALTNGTVRSINCDTTGISEGASGATMTWTISITPRDTATFTGTRVAPANTPYAAGFPTATDAFTTAGSLLTYTYYRAAGDSLFLLGFGDSLKTIVFFKPELFALSSLAFGSSFTAVYGYRDSTAIAGATVVSKFDATRTVTFDGTGTLVLPWKTFAHAMRYKTILSLTDSTQLSALLTTVVKTDMTTFTWIDTTLPGNTSFSITRSTIQSIAGSTTSMSVTYTEPTVSTGIRLSENGPMHAAGSFVVSASDNAVTIRTMPSARPDNVLLTAYDLRGRTTATVRCHAGAAGVTSGAFTAPLTKGIYLYSLNTGNDLLGRGKFMVR